jgi:hypothetical protein
MSEENKQNKDLDDLQNSFKKLESELTDMVKSIGDVTKFNDLSEEIHNLRNMGNPAATTTTDNEVTNKPPIDTTTPPVDGETCMHGNSWHAGCSECDEFDDVEIALNEISNIIDNEPNDKLLGKKIRDFYNNWIDFNENKVDTTVD